MRTSGIPTMTTEVEVHLGGGVAVPLSEAVCRLRCLPVRERNVLALRLGLVGRPRSVARTASVLGMTPQRVRAIEALAGSKLRHPSCGVAVDVPEALP